LNHPSLDEVVTNEVANRLRPVLITLAADTDVECGEKVLFKRDSEPGDCAHVQVSNTNNLTVQLGRKTFFHD
jgi:hypothetical protein